MSLRQPQSVCLHQRSHREAAPWSGGSFQRYSKPNTCKAQCCGYVRLSSKRLARHAHSFEAAVQLHGASRDTKLPNALAQYFYVDKATYPNGFNLTDLRFQGQNGQNPEIVRYTTDHVLSLQQV